MLTKKVQHKVERMERVIDYCEVDLFPFVAAVTLQGLVVLRESYVSYLLASFQINQAKSKDSCQMTMIEDGIFH